MSGQEFKRSKIEEGENYMENISTESSEKSKYYIYRKNKRKVDAVMKLDARWDDKLTISFKGPYI